MRGHPARMTARSRDCGHTAERTLRTDVTQLIQVSGKGVVNVPIALDPQATQQLDALHKLNVKATLTFTASGGTSRTKTTVMQLVKGPSSVSKLSVSPSKFSLAGRKSKDAVSRRLRGTAETCGAGPIALSVSYTLNVPTTVTFTVKLQASGRRVKGRCMKPTSKNRKLRACTRVLNLPGKIVQPGKASTNRFASNGRIGGHQLGFGSDYLVATPVGGKPQATTFKIVR